MNNFSFKVLSLSFSNQVSDPKYVNRAICGGLAKMSGPVKKFHCIFDFSVFLHQDCGSCHSVHSEVKMMIFFFIQSIESQLFKSGIGSKISLPGDPWRPRKDEWSSRKNFAVYLSFPVFYTKFAAAAIQSTVKLG